MRWFWQRRRQREASVLPPAAPSAPSLAVQRAAATSGRLGQPRQLTSELLLLARDYLQAAGGHVRVEDEDVLSAPMPDGSLARYTTTVAKARADDSMTLLVEGSAALSAMLATIAAHARLSAIRLAPTADPIALALQQCAAPAATCGRCLTASNTSNTALCATCPQRDGRIVLHWRGSGPLTGRVVDQQQTRSVELAYLIAARDHRERRDDWIRYAVDGATGRAVPSVSEAALSAAQPDELPENANPMLGTASGAAEGALGPQLTAVGSFLRQRSLDEYRRRLDEVALTFDRLQREAPEAARAAKAGRARELAALSEVYAVDVEARMESACFISSPQTIVALRPAKGRGELRLLVDIGRQYVAPPGCSVCEAQIQTGYVCEAGHPTCARCAAVCARCGAWACALCDEAQTDAELCPSCGGPNARRARTETEDGATADDGAFTVYQLEQLPPQMWIAAVEWILSSLGVEAQPGRAARNFTVLQGESSTGRVAVAAHRPGGAWALDDATIREIAAHLGGEQQGNTRMILTSAVATTPAIETARQLGLQLIDRNELESILSTLATAQAQERDRQLGEIQVRADAASALQHFMLQAMDDFERTLAPVRRAKRASTQAGTGAAASRSLARVRSSIERAALVWETLLGDWAAAFGELPARDGTLVIQVDHDGFRAMSERAAHLQAILADAATHLAGTSAHGDAGYSAWRQAVLDECRARCDAWRWRIRTFDPAAWHDFTRAWNAKAAAQAAEAITAAAHATARADKAQAQALRAG